MLIIGMQTGISGASDWLTAQRATVELFAVVGIFLKYSV